ncbi:MAG TPA: ABC transporter permease [Candidatus Lumbricidophila sp.]|nr:ABC transporter permease [Candidatus Lumbricidophila sp.]
MSLTDSIEARARNVASQPLVVTNRRGGFLVGTAHSVRDIWAHRGLLYLLVRREIRSRYKNSTLGIVWSLARPLVQLGIYYFAIGHMLGARSSIPDFAIFVFIGITMWGLFADIVSGATTSLNANAGLVKKVYLPREIFPLSTAGSALFNFGVQLVVLLSAIAIWGSFAFDPRLLLAPLSVAVLLVFATALGVLFSAVNVYLRDTEHFVEIGLLLGFWFAPIVYSYSFVHKALDGNWIEQIFLSNPVTLAVIGMQRALWTGGSNQPWPPGLEFRLLVALLASVVLLWLTQRIFARLQGNFAQEM